MKTLFQLFIRVAVVAAVLLSCLGSGSFAMAAAWLLTGWVVVRAAPGCFRDLRALWRLGAGLSNDRFSFRGGFKMKEDIGL